MSLPGDIVDVVMRVITGGVEMTKAQREAAKAEVRDTLARAELADRRDLLGVQADEITARHLARVRALASPQLVSDAARLRILADPADIAPQGTPTPLERASLRIVDEEDGG